MDRNELVDFLKDKYQYDDNTLAILQSIIPAMISYFGPENEEKIINSFASVPITFVNDENEIQEFANKVGIKNEYTLPTFASGGYEEYFQINDNNQIERIPFIMIRAKEMNEFYLNTIIHECCHMVMNYGKAQVIDGKIVSKTGISKDEIEFVDGQAKITSSDTYFEEGINEYNSREITKLITGKEIEKGNYDKFYDYVRPLMKDEESRQKVNQSRLDGDDTWKDVLGTELSNQYMNALEEYVNTTLNFGIPRAERKQKTALLKEKLNELMNIVDQKMKSRKINGELSNFDYSNLELESSSIYENEQTGKTR